MSRGEINTPKNHKNRRVDMSMQLINTLDTLLAEVKADAVRRNPQNPDEALNAVIETSIFVRPNGRRLDSNDSRRQILYRALHLAGIRRVRLHDLRHTFASLLIQQREDLLYIRDQLGRFSIQITVDIYGHLVPGGNRQAVNKLADDQSGESPAGNGSKTVADDPRASLSMCYLRTTAYSTAVHTFIAGAASNHDGPTIGTGWGVLLVKIRRNTQYLSERATARGLHR